MTEAMTSGSDEQARRYCNHLMDAETGKRCRNSAGRGTSHPGYGTCDCHGGDSPNLIKAAARQQVAEMASLSTDIDVDPDTVMLSAIGRAWGAVYWCADRIEAIQAEAQTVSDDETKRRENLAKQLIVMNQMYGEWLERAAKFAKVAKDAGIAERLVKIEEDKVKQAGDLIRGIFKDLDISIEDPKVREALRRNFALIHGGAA